MSLISGDKPSLSGGEGTLEWTLPCFEVFDRSKLRQYVDFLIFLGFLSPDFSLIFSVPVTSFDSLSRLSFPSFYLIGELHPDDDGGFLPEKFHQSRSAGPEMV